MNERKHALKAPVEMVYNLLDSLNKQAISNGTSAEEIQAEVVKLVNFLRYDDGKNYVWIHNKDDIFVFHPNPKNIGKDFSNVADKNGVKFIAEMTKIARANGDGYVEYLFPKPIDVNTPLPKISYVKYYDKWDYVIGTGTWIDGIEEKISSAKKVVIIASIVIVLLSLGLGIYVSMKISSALKQAVTKIINLSEGQF